MPRRLPGTDAKLILVVAAHSAPHRMSFINELLAGITPPPVVTPEHYDGWQLKWRIFVFRPAGMSSLAPPTKLN